MNALKVIQEKSRSQFCQYLLIDENGMLYESCNTIFDTDPLLSNSFQSWFPFMESVFPELKKLDISNEIKFSKLHQPSSFLNGIYDFTFSKIKLKQKTYLVWLVYDKTSLYLKLLSYQQQKNEFEIQRQAYEAKTQFSTSSIDFKSAKSIFDPLHHQGTSVKAIKFLEILRKKGTDSKQLFITRGEDIFGVVDEKITALEKLKVEMKDLRQVQHTLPSDIIKLSKTVIERILPENGLAKIIFKPAASLSNLKTRYAITVGRILFILLTMFKTKGSNLASVLSLNSEKDNSHTMLAFELAIDLDHYRFKDENIVIEEKIKLLGLLCQDIEAQIYGNFGITPNRLAIIFTFPLKID